MRIAFDTNILVYLAGIDRVAEDEAKIEAALKVHAQLARTCICIAPLQTLGELFEVVARLRRSRKQARETVKAFREIFDLAPSGPTTFSAALDVATDHNLQFWDALILCSAAEAGCTLLLSEDMQDGFVWRGITVVNPFAEVIDERLARMIVER
jgi:predicted nucleic acid-binding protein